MRFRMTWYEVMPLRGFVSGVRAQCSAIVEAPTWMDAKAFAATVEMDAVTVPAPVDDPMNTTVELRWEGNDGASGGGPNAKHLRVSKLTKEGWSQWQRL